MSKCVGCGINLQDQDKEKLGYTPNLKNKYCVRCFRLLNYGELKDEIILDNKEILTKINKQKGLVFFLVDFLNITKETIAIFKQIKLPKILVISKSDILRKEMKFSKIIKWLEDVYQIKEEVLFLSNKSKNLKINILKYDYKNIYICGITNAGKSTFMNQLLKENNISKEIVVSKVANTTLDFIKLKIEDKYVYDTPGFTYSTLVSTLNNEELNFISYNLKAKTTLVLNRWWKIYFKEANQVTLYVNTKNVKKEFIIDKSLKESISIPQNYELIIPGIGFMNVKKATEVLTNFSYFEVRKDISGEDYE